MKRLTIIFFFFIIGYALYWCISDYNYRYNNISVPLKSGPVKY